MMLLLEIGFSVICNAARQGLSHGLLIIDNHSHSTGTDVILAARHAIRHPLEFRKE